MYAQNPRPREEDLTLPQNYSGTAFRYPPIGSLREESPPPMPAHPDRPTESRREGGTSLFGGMTPSASPASPTSPASPPFPAQDVRNGASPQGDLTYPSEDENTATRGTAEFQAETVSPTEGEPAPDESSPHAAQPSSPSGERLPAEGRSTEGLLAEGHPSAHGWRLPSLRHGEAAEDDLLLLGLLLLLSGNGNDRCDESEKNANGGIVTYLLLLLLCG